MLTVLHLHNYSTGTLMYMALFILMAGAVIGFVTDSVMGSRGFGPFGNGILVIFGAMLGIYIRNAFFGAMQSGDLAVTGIFAGASATLLLLLLGIAKHWVQD